MLYFRNFSSRSVSCFLEHVIICCWPHAVQNTYTIALDLTIFYTCSEVAEAIIAHSADALNSFKPSVCVISDLNDVVSLITAVSGYLQSTDWSGDCFLSHTGLPMCCSLSESAYSQGRALQSSWYSWSKAI